MKRRIAIFLAYIICVQQVFGAILVSEIMPNTHDDTTDEYFELYNNSNEALSLSGYSVSDVSGKSYTFGSEESLGAFESKKYFRPNTKILLNNSDETVFLHNPSGELVGEYSYSNTEKGEKIVYFEIPIGDKGFSGSGGIDNSDEENDSSGGVGSGTLDHQESGSGVLIESGESDLNISSSGALDSIETSSGNVNTDNSLSGSLNHSGALSSTGTSQEVDSGTGNIVGSGSLGGVPDIEIEVQSGLYTLSGGIYECKTQECRVNLSIEKIFTGAYNLSDFSCNWDFGTGSLFSTGTDLKCNPGYVYFPDYKSYSGAVIVTDKNNDELYKRKDFVIQKTFEKIVGKADSSQSGSTLSGSSSPEEVISETENNQENIIATGSLYQTGSMSFDFQNPSYVTNKNSSFSEYYCDQTKTECRINFDFRPSFSGGLSESDFYCIGEYGTGVALDQREKCNPSTIEFPTGTYDIHIQIFYKKTDYLYAEKSIKLINNGYIAPVKKSSSSSSSSSSMIQKIEKINLNDSDIIIQSGLDENNICKKSPCSINLEYQVESSDQKCVWDFGPKAEYSESTKEKCNPGYIKYHDFGEYEIKLKTYQKDYEQNYLQKTLLFSHKKPEEEIDQQEKIEGNLQDQDNRDYGIQDYSHLKFGKIMANPHGNDSDEYIEITNNSDQEIWLFGCILDDIKQKGSKPYIFTKTDKISAKSKKKFYKYQTKINLNNDADELYLECGGKEIDSLFWNFDVPSGYYLSKERLNIVSQEVLVQRVIDGDTLEIKIGDHIDKLRLIGINTPESVHPNKEVEFLGKQVSDYVKSTLEGKKVYIEIEEQNLRDKYGRLLGYVFFDNQNFNQHLLEKGYAKAYLDFPFKYSSEFKKSEYLAKKQKIGIWQEKSIAKAIIQEQNDIIVEDTQSNKLTTSSTDKKVGKKLFSLRVPENFIERKTSQNSIVNSVYKRFDIPDTKRSYKNYEYHVQKSLNQSVRKNKTGLKIGGKTLPVSIIRVDIVDKNNDSLFGKNIIESKKVKTNEYGSYSIGIDDLKPGKYFAYTKVYDSFGNTIDILEPKEFEITYNYYFSRLLYEEQKQFSLEQKNIAKENKEMKHNQIKNSEPLKAILTLQGRMGQKKMIDNVLYCYDSCSINFDGRKSTGNIEKYVWDFGNTQSYIGANPKYIKYNSPGNYTVTLTISNGEKTVQESLKIVYFGKKKKKKSSSKIMSPKIDAGDDNDIKTEFSDNQEQIDDKYGIYFKIFIMMLSIFLGFILLRRHKII